MFIYLFFFPITHSQLQTLITLRNFNLEISFYNVSIQSPTLFRVFEAKFGLNTIPLDIVNREGKLPHAYKTEICDSSDHFAYFDTRHAIFLTIRYRVIVSLFFEPFIENYKFRILSLEHREITNESKEE